MWPMTRRCRPRDAQRVAQLANGHWQGRWLDSAGHSGTNDVTISIDSTKRTARAELSFTGPLLGSAIASQVYEVDLLSFVLTADNWDVISPQFGKVTIVPGGADSASATATMIPGHTDIASIDVSASRLSQRIDLNYTIAYVDGHTVKGRMAWATSGRADAKAASDTRRRAEPDRRGNRHVRGGTCLLGNRSRDFSVRTSKIRNPMEASSSTPPASTSPTP